MSIDPTKRIGAALCAAVLLLACTNPQQRKAEAEADLAEQRAAAARDYRKCLATNTGKPEQAQTCEPFRAAAETLAR